jgi:hypothetical protein
MADGSLLPEILHHHDVAAALIVLGVEQVPSIG